MARAEDVPLAPAAHFTYQRTPRDRFWALLFGLVWLGCVAAGLWGATHM